MSKFMLEGPWPCKIFCFALIHYMWVTQPTRFYWLDPQYSVNNYCVLCTVMVKKANKNLKERTLSGFIIIPLYELQLQNRTCKRGAIFSAICRQDIARVSNMFETWWTTLAPQKLQRVSSTKIACVNGSLLYSNWNVLRRKYLCKIPTAINALSFGSKA